MLISIFKLLTHYNIPDIASEVILKVPLKITLKFPFKITLKVTIQLIDLIVHVFVGLHEPIRPTLIACFFNLSLFYISI